MEQARQGTRWRRSTRDQEDHRSQEEIVLIVGSFNQEEVVLIVDSFNRLHKVKVLTAVLLI
jgi:hypothetical protein